MSKQHLLSSLLCLSVCLFFVGCAEDTGTADTAVAESDHAELGHGGHHHHEGPHGGLVLEVDGHHQYHAEATFDAETRDVTVYILGGDLQTPVPVAAGDIEFEIEAGDDEEHLEMTAAPLEGEEGVSSVYTIPGDKIPESAKSLNDFHWHMHVTIDSEEYNVAPAHDDHAEHGDHDEHEDHADGDKDAEHADDHDEADHKDGDAEHKDE